MNISYTYSQNNIFGQLIIFYDEHYIHNYI